MFSSTRLKKAFRTNAPLLLLLNFAVQSLTSAVIACGIFFALWAIYTLFIFRRKIFKKHYANKPAPVWKEEV